MLQKIKSILLSVKDVMHQLVSGLGSVFKRGIKWALYIGQYFLWALSVGWGRFRWYFLYAIWPIRWLLRTTIWCIRPILDLDIRAANRKQREVALQLERQWNDGNGRINADELIEKMDAERIEFSYEIARNEYNREIERRGGLIVDRTSAVMAAAALVLAALCSVAQLGSPVFTPENQFQWISVVEYPVNIGFWSLIIIGFVQLAWGISLCMNILVSSQIWEPSWETILGTGNSSGTEAQNEAMYRGHLRLLLFSTARNQVETQFRLNQNNAALRHFKIGIYAMFIVLALRAVPHVSQWIYQHTQTNIETNRSLPEPANNTIIKT